MIDLRLHHEPLLLFIEQAIAGFRREKPETEVAHAALYCCPWSGWVSICLDRTVQPHQNCPDFEFFEIALYGAAEWREEYEAGPVVQVSTLDGRLVSIDIEADGDEPLNEYFFDFLRSLLQDARARAALETMRRGSLYVGVQLLDSSFNEAWPLVT